LTALNHTFLFKVTINVPTLQDFQQSSAAYQMWGKS